MSWGDRKPPHTEFRKGVAVSDTPTISKLLPQHAELIRASRISQSVAEARSYRTLRSAAAIKRCGFRDAQCNAPALLIPIYDVRGDLALYQIRPDSPRVVDGKLIKCETPKDSRMVLDAPPTAREWVSDPSRPNLPGSDPRALASHTS